MTNDDKRNNLPIWDKPFIADGLHESNNAFECFIKYRDMGAKRSLVTIAKEDGIKYQKLCDWSSKYHWNDRIQSMIENANAENQRINARMKKKSLDMINQRLDTKNEIIDAIFNVLKDNVSKYSGTELDLKEFASLFHLAMKLESMNIEDLSNIHDVEQIFKDGGVDAQKIQAFINNYGTVLTSFNNDAIDKYKEDVKDDNY